MRFLISFFGVCVLFSTSCMKWDYGDASEDFHTPGSGLFILCEGNFQYGNSELSFYDPATQEVENDIFYRANGMKLGDVAQSMCMYGGKGWIVVNNSHVVFAIDPDNFRETGRIENLTSPRYIHFVSDEKAYVSQLWDNRIYIVNPRKYETTGYIEIPGMSPESGSTEQMVQIGRYVYCSCWSYQNSILKIDSETDKVVARLETGIQPRYMVKDCEDRLWVMTDGGFEGSPYGYEAPALFRINAEEFVVEEKFGFKKGDTPTDLQTDADGRTLFWINGDVWKMDINSERLPVKPFIESRDTRYYALTVSPADGDVYVADAIDYQQQGMIYRYSSDGLLLGEFYVGVTPGAFCWK